MMQVSEITVRYLRRVQVKEYEPAEAEVSLTGHLYDGEENVLNIATDLMNTARSTAIAGLSGKAGKTKATVEGKFAEKADRQAGKASALAEGYSDKDADKDADAALTKIVADAKAVDDLPDDTPADPPKKRGRPKGSKNKPAADKADIPADIPDTTDDLPYDDTVSKPSDSTAGASADTPDDLPDDVPGDEPSPPTKSDDGVMTVDELQLFITGVVGQTSGKLPVATIKACLGKYGADRTSDVAAEDREKVKADIEAELLGI